MGKVNHDSKRQRRIRKKRQKENNPLLYYYNVHKQNAVKRELEFSITFEYWKKLWNNDIVNMKNKGLTLDRINPKKGYTNRNVRLISLTENATNGATIDKEIHNGKKTTADKKRAEQDYSSDF